MNSEIVDIGLFLLVDEIKYIVDCRRAYYNYHRPYSSLAYVTYAGFGALRSRTGFAGLHTQQTDEAGTCLIPSWRKDQEKAGKSFEAYF